VGVRDHQVDASKAPLSEGGDELRSEGLSLAIAHLETKKLPPAIGIHPHRHHRSARGDLLSLALPPIEVSGIQVDLGIASLLQRPVQDSLDRPINLLADATHLRLGDAALGVQGRDQGINLSGRHPADVSLHDHGVEGLVDPPTALEDRGQEAAGP
jgi:hypothetical protein